MEDTTKRKTMYNNPPVNTTKQERYDKKGQALPRSKNLNTR